MSHSWTMGEDSSQGQERPVIIGGWRGPGWRVVDADPHQVRPVRDWIRAALSRPDSPVDPDEAALVVSELYTNSVMHGPAGGRVLIGYCLWPAGARIVVGDGGGLTAPQVRWDAGLAEGGRGLQVIHALAAQWDSFRLPGAQVVWCDLGQPLHAPAADAWAWLHRVLASRPLAAGPTGRLPANANLLASVTLGQVERLSVVEAVLAVGI